VVTIHNNQTDEKHKGCNLRLNTATEHEETMSLSNVFQMSTIRLQKKLASRTDVVRCLYNLMETTNPKFLKSNMADGRHIGLYIFLAITPQWLVRFAWNLVRDAKFVHS